MVTGDNAQCGYYIAKECGMVAPYVSVMLGDVCKDGRLMTTYRLCFTNLKVELDDLTALLTL